MSESTKTLTFVGVAVAALLIAWGTAPKPAQRSASDETGTMLVEKEFDPLTIGSLEIVTYDDATGEIHPFKVAKSDIKGKRRWSIPSHDNYPTDAKDQFGEVVANLTGLKILGTVADAPGRFAEFGVVNPDAKECKLGDTGVGKRVVLKDQQDKNLVAIIIGKEVVDHPQNRYVRRIDQDGKGGDRVYEVAIKADKITSQFDAWIDKNLLGMNSFDLKGMFIRDYAVDATQGAIMQHGEMGIEYNDAGTPKWKLVENNEYGPDATTGEGGWTAVNLADDEETNQTRLDEMKTAMDDLKIVDVRRKPEGLSADLKASGDFIKSRETVESLMEMGFYAAKMDGKIELFSNNGETRIDMKDGAQYVLRFGGAAMDSAAGPAEKGKEKAAGMNRYLFVMAEFNPDALAKPELESAPAEEKKAVEGDKVEGDKAEGDKAAEEAKPEEGKDAKAETPKMSDADRQAMEKRNKQKIDEYNAKVKKGQDRVKELNDRFSDWYYIISEDVFKKIHLTRTDVVKKKDAPKDGDGHDHKEHADPEEDPMGAFDAIKQQGLKP